MKLSNTLDRLRFIGLCEGWSFVLLLFIAMPLKYFAGQPAAVKIVGMGHGVLFIALIAAALHAHFYYKWSMKQTCLVIAGAFLPFGPFIVDLKILKPLTRVSA